MIVLLNNHILKSYTNIFPHKKLHFSFKPFIFFFRCDESLSVLDVHTGDVKFFYPHSTKLWGCEFSSCNRIIAAVDDGKRITLRDIETDEHEHILYTNKNTEAEQESVEARAKATAKGKEKEALGKVEMFSSLRIYSLCTILKL